MIRWAGPVLCTIVAIGPLAAQRRPIRRDSLRTLEAVVRRDSLDPVASFELGRGLWSRRRFIRADSAFRRTLTLAPDHPGAHLALSVLPHVRGERYFFDTLRLLPPDSLDGLVLALERHARHAYLTDPLVDLSVLRDVGAEILVPSIRRPAGSAQVDPWWLARSRRGVRHLIEGRPDSALVEFDRLRNSREVVERGRYLPDLVVWYYALAAGRIGKYDRAAAGFRELAQRMYRWEQVAPDWVAPGSRALMLYYYGVMSDRAGRPDIARAALEEALVIDISLYQAHARLADLAEIRGQIEVGLEERRRAIAVSPETGTLHHDLGVSLLRAGRPVPAESAFVRAAELLPYDPSTHYYLAVVARQNGHRAQERTALERFLLLTPSRNADRAAEARGRLEVIP
jgi:tetratricopeptide (TPR) repeat protein